MQIRALPSTHATSLSLRLFTHNIRYAATGADLLPNERPWAERLPLILNQFRHHTRFLDILAPSSTHGVMTEVGPTAFICLQEVLHHQLTDILTGLGPAWSSVGVGRDDGKTSGEYSPIIYPAQVFECLHRETIWLSPTPDRPSRGWDAGSIRILTLAVFQHRRSGARLLVGCTHLDNAGVTSREKSVDVILDAIRGAQGAWAAHAPVFLAGDFNSFPTDPAYLKMVQSGLVADAREYVLEEKRYGDGKTFTAFKPDQDMDSQGRIDFIWLGPAEAVKAGSTRRGRTDDDETDASRDRQTWDVAGYAVLSNVFGDEEVYCSDHRCVVVDAVLKLHSD